jgi:hypothetical protein
MQVGREDAGGRAAQRPHQRANETKAPLPRFHPLCAVAVSALRLHKSPTRKS